MSSADRRVTAGARKLRAIITASGLTVEQWAAKHGFEQGTLSNLLRGARWRAISVDTAWRISRATRGAVKLEDFRSETARAA